MSIRLTPPERERLLDELDALLASRDDLHVCEIDESGETARIVVIADDPAALSGMTEHVFEAEGGRVAIPVEVRAGRRLRADLGRAEDLALAHGPALAPGNWGRSGSLIQRATDGGWGTLTVSTKAINIQIVRRRRVVQSCSRQAPTLVTNSHVVRAVGTEMLYTGARIGVADCHFNLNWHDSADYGQIAWDRNVDPANYFRAIDDTDPAGRKIENLAAVAPGMAVSKQGARTGWTSGAVGNRRTIKLDGYNGTFRCWQGSYAAMGGDSGSPVLHLSGGKWFVVGIHFAENSHFWSWDAFSNLSEDVGLTITL